MTGIQYIGNEKQIINELFSLSNVYYTNAEFEKEEQQNIINNYSDNIQWYSRSSYLKMFNLFRSVIKLADYPNEAKIIIRTMFEHLINFYYVFENTSEIDKKIERFYDYQYDITPSYFLYETYKRLEDKKAKNNQNLDEYEDDLLIKSKNEVNQHNVEDKRTNFIKKYESEFNDKSWKEKNNKLQNWTGKTFNSLFMDIMQEKDKKEEDKIFANYKHLLYKIYNYLCLYVHCGDLIFIDNTKNEISDRETIESLYLANYIFSFFINNFYPKLGQESHNTPTKIYIEKFIEISELYDLQF